MKQITLYVLAMVVTMVICGKCPDKCTHPRTENECQECAKRIASSSLIVGGKKLTFEQGGRVKWLKLSGGQASCRIGDAV